MLRVYLIEKTGALSSLPASLASILVPIGIWSISGAVLDDKGEKVAGRICACTAVAALITMFVRLTRVAEQTAEKIAGLCESAAPLLATLLSAAGGVTSAALLTPAASMAAQMCADIICGVTIPVIGCAGIIAVAPAFSERFSFSGARKLITGACNWLHGGMLAVFTGLLSVRGILKGGADSLSMQTARYTVDSLLPVVGGDVADSLGLLVASAKAVQSGVGIACCTLLLLTCAAPVLTAASYFLLIRICRALAEPLATKGATALLDGFSEVFSAMLVAIVCAIMLFVLLVGASVSMARSII